MQIRNLPSKEEQEAIPRPFHQQPLKQSTRLLANPTPVPPSSRDIMTIKLTLFSRGHPVTCARIYRLTTSNLPLRPQWLALASSILHPPNKRTLNTTSKSSPHHTVANKHLLASFPANEPHPLRTAQTAYSLLPPREKVNDGPLQPSHSDYPNVSGTEDPIGFVTTGNYVLGHGKGSAIGCVAVSKAVQSRGQESMTR